MPLGFRFDVDALVVGGVAHRTDCHTLPRPLPAGATTVAVGDVYRADSCPGECRVCQPPFETVIGYELGPTGAPVACG